jgi:hypothetical protein
MIAPLWEPSGPIVSLAALPDLSDFLACFLLRPAPYSFSQGEELNFVLRMQATAEVPRGDILCRAYPLAGEELVEPEETSWNHSPHFEALYCYLPTFSATDPLVPLTPFTIDRPFDRLVLAVQVWRESAADVAVGACLLRRNESHLSQTTSYRLVPALDDA